MLRPRAQMERTATTHRHPPSSSLYGMERTIPPSQSKDVSSSSGRMSKATISGTRRRPPPIDRTSSSYSTGLDDLFELYHAGDEGQFDPSSGPNRTLQPVSHRHVEQSVSLYRQPQQDSGLKTSLRSSRSRKGANDHSRTSTDFWSNGHRYSFPEPPSPDSGDLGLTTVLSDSDYEENDMAKMYRASLLPTPFSTMSSKSKPAFQENLPLRSSKPLRSPSFQPQNRSNSESSAAPSMTTSDGSPTERSGMSVDHSYGSARTRYEPSTKRIQEAQSRWTHRDEGLAIRSNTRRGQDLYELSPVSSSSDLLEFLRPRPVPIPYDWPQENPEQFASLEISLTADSASQYEPTPIQPLPRENWSCTPKPSNPYVARVPHSEISPTVGMPPTYRTKSIRVREQKENNKAHELRKPVPGRQTYESRQSFSEQEKSHKNNTGEGYSNRYSSMPHPPHPPKTPQTTTQDSSTSQNCMPSRSSSSRSRHSTIESIQQTSSKVGSRLKSAIMARFSASKLKDVEQLVSKSIVPRETVEERSSFSWTRSRQERAAKAQQEERRAALKKRITILAVTDSIGVAGNTAILKESPPKKRPSPPSWYSANRDLAYPPGQDLARRMDARSRESSQGPAHRTWI